MMMRSTMGKILGAAALATALALTGCEEEGPAEKAGKKIDQGTDNAARQIDQAAEEIKKTLGK